MRKTKVGSVLVIIIIGVLLLALVGCDVYFEEDDEGTTISKIKLVIGNNIYYEDAVYNTLHDLLIAMSVKGTIDGYEYEEINGQYYASKIDTLEDDIDSNLVIMIYHNIEDTNLYQSNMMKRDSEDNETLRLSNVGTNRIPANGACKFIIVVEEIF